MEPEIRPITADEFAAFVRTDATAFSDHISDDEIARTRQTFELERSLAAFADGEIAATTAAYSFELALPGPTTLPIAGVSYVAVLPTHRRQGLLRRLMRRQLDDLRARGEAVAALTASESGIYGRFGYGAATDVIYCEIARTHAAFARPTESSGRLRLCDHVAAFEVLIDVYNRVRMRQPGAVSRGMDAWREILRYPNGTEEAAARLFYAVHESAQGHADGIAVYGVENNWADGLPANTLHVRELFAATPRAYAALWRFCLDTDLVGTIKAQKRPVDEPLRWLLAEPRRLRVTRWTDDLWLRLVDVPAALAARRYATNGGIVLDVYDAFCPWNTGRYYLDGGTEGATCRPTTAPADLALDVADLGAAYLGGTRLGALARAGRVSELTTGALQRAEALFATDPAPWCATPF